MAAFDKEVELKKKREEVSTNERKTYLMTNMQQVEKI